MKKVCIPDITSLSDLDLSDLLGAPERRHLRGVEQGDSSLSSLSKTMGLWMDLSGMEGGV